MNALGARDAVNAMNPLNTLGADHGRSLGTSPAERWGARDAVGHFERDWRRISVRSEMMGRKLIKSMNERPLTVLLAR